MRKDLFIISFFIALNVFSQDSLHVNEKIQKAESLIGRDYIKAINFLQEAIEIAKEKHLIEGEIRAINILSNLYVEQLGDIQKADSLLREAYNKSVKHNYKRGKAIISLKQGAIEATQGYFSSALEKCTEAIANFEKLKDTSHMIISIRNLGYIHSELGNFDKATSNLLKAIELAELSKNHLQEAELLIGLQKTKISNNLLDDIDVLFEKLGFVLSKINVKDLKNNFLEGRLYLNYANYYYKTKQYNKSIEYAKKSYNLMKDNRYELTYLMLRFAKAYQKLGNLKLAENYCKKGIDLAKKNGILKLELTLNEEYLKILKLKKSSYKTKYKVAESIIVLKDSIYNTQILKEIANISRRYEISRRDKELSIQKSTIQQQEIKLLKQRSKTRFITIAALILIVILIGGYYVLNQRKRLIKKRLEAAEHQQKLAKIQDILEGEERERQRIAQELHDGVNGDLVVLKMQISNIKPLQQTIKQEIIPHVDIIINTLRQISHELSTATLQHNSLVSVLEGYAIDIKNASKKNIIFETYGKTKRIEAAYKTAIFRIVQELITNAIKHSEASEICIIVNSHNTYFDITVEDNGNGFDVSKVKKGIGLYNINNRVNILQADFDLKSNNKGTTATLKVYYDKLTIYQKNKSNI